MGIVYLAYVENSSSGSAPADSATFFACTLPMEKEDDNKLFLPYALQTCKKPREVLEDLEHRAFASIYENPSYRDLLQGKPDDNKPKYADFPRHFGYLAETSWESSARRRKIIIKIKKKTADRNSLLLALYISFIDSVSVSGG